MYLSGTVGHDEVCEILKGTESMGKSRESRVESLGALGSYTLALAMVDW